MQPMRIMTGGVPKSHSVDEVAYEKIVVKSAGKPTVTWNISSKWQYKFLGAIPPVSSIIGHIECVFI